VIAKSRVQAYNAVWDALARESQLLSPSHDTIYGGVQSSINPDQQSTIQGSLQNLTVNFVLP
jgi:hypothetical protein